MQSVKIQVATALTVYGIETYSHTAGLCCLAIELQQHLPFTVLKLRFTSSRAAYWPPWLQQHLPFTVLKLDCSKQYFVYDNFASVATALTVYGIETRRYRRSIFRYIL